MTERHQSHQRCYMILIHRIGIAVFLILFSASMLFAAENEVTLKAEHMAYDETSHQVQASENVQIQYDNLQIKGPRLSMDVDQETIWGTGNITLQRGNDTIRSSAFFFDIQNNIVQVEDVSLTIKPKEISTGNLYLKVKKLEDQTTRKSGTTGFATTCDANPPHYAVYADRFDYIPENGIYGYNVWIDCPIYFIPFGLWFPVYHYALGKRNPVLLMPLIGQNNVEGYFVRSTWDYFLARNQTGSIYLDWMEKKGVGIGVNHQYRIPKVMEGSVMYYRLNEEDTGINDYNVRVDHTSHLTDVLDVKLGLEDVKGYTISGGRKQNNMESIALVYDDLGDRYAGSFSERYNPLQANRTQEIKLERSFNQNKDLSFTYTNSMYDSSLSGQTSYRKDMMLLQSYELPWDMSFSDQIHYQANKGFADTVADERMDLALSLTKRFDKTAWFSSIKGEVTHYFDLDGNKYTNDNNQEYLQKMPEVTMVFQPQTFFDKNPSFNIQIDKRLILGEYEEARYLSSSDRLRVIRADRIRYEQNISTKLKKVLGDTDFEINLGYNQNAYQVADTGKNTIVQDADSAKKPPLFWSGDSLYTFTQTYTHTLDWWKFLANKVEYSNQNSYGYTPFFFDDNTQKQSLITEALSLYFLNINQYKWTHNAGWDFQKDRPLDYATELLIQPIPEYRFNLKTGYHFGDTNWKQLSDGYWNDLVGTIELQPSHNTDLDITRFRLQAIYNLKKGELTALSKDLNIAIGHDWESSWLIDTHWEYELFSKRYMLKTISLVKDLHCRELRLSYNDTIQEWRFTYSIKAFPSEPIGFKSSKTEPFQVQGVLDDQATERF